MDICMKKPSHKALFGSRGSTGFAVSNPGPILIHQKPRTSRSVGRFWMGLAPMDPKNTRRVQRVRVE
jgi:hypothetical protein